MTALAYKYETPMYKTQENPILQQSSPLGEAGNLFCDFFEQLVDDCCNRIDIEFGIQLGEKRNLIDKEVYTNLLKSLREQKIQIKKEYLTAINTLFQSGHEEILNTKNIDVLGAGLATNEAVEESHAIKMIIKRTNHLFLEELSLLNTTIANLQGKRAISAHENPVCPENLVHTLTTVISKLDLKISYRIAIYKAFEENVFKQLGFIYKELIKNIETSHTNTISEEKPKPNTNNQDNNETHEYFKKLQDKLTTWRSTNPSSSYDLMPQLSDQYYEVYEVIQALEIIRQFNVYDNDDFTGAQKPIKWLVIGKLEEINLENGTKCLARNEEDVLDLISMLFENIQNDETIGQELKSTLLKIEFPLAELTLSNYGFLINTKGSGRQLLDNLFTAAQFLNVEDPGSSFTKCLIENLVNEICTDSSCGANEIHSLINDFSATMDKNKKRSQILQQRTLQLFKNKESLELSKQVVNKEINLCIEGQVLPEIITDFLFNVWQDLLLIVFINKEDNPEAWNNSINTMKNLVLSVVPPHDETERKRILKLLPVLIKDLRSGLKRISYDKYSQSRFFKELAVYHIQLMNKKEFPHTSTQPQSQLSSITENVSQDNITENKPPIQANPMQLEQWFFFNNEPTAGWGQLVWKSTDTDQYFFADKNGKKLLNLPSAELIELFEKGKASQVPYNQQAITERILHHL